MQIAKVKVYMFSKLHPYEIKYLCAILSMCTCASY